MFNSEQDHQILISENKRLQDKFHGDFVKTKFGKEGKICFSCELCNCTVKSEKCLEIHCEEKNHLKKKEEVLLHE